MSSQYGPCLILADSPALYLEYRVQKKKTSKLRNSAGLFSSVHSCSIQQTTWVGMGAASLLSALPSMLISLARSTLAVVAVARPSANSALP